MLHKTLSNCGERATAADGIKALVRMPVDLAVVRYLQQVGRLLGIARNQEVRNKRVVATVDLLVRAERKGRRITLLHRLFEASGHVLADNGQIRFCECCLYFRHLRYLLLHICELLSDFLDNEHRPARSPDDRLIGKAVNFD
jgi:hypothetical protein